MSRSEADPKEYGGGANDSRRRSLPSRPSVLELAATNKTLRQSQSVQVLRQYSAGRSAVHSAARSTTNSAGRSTISNADDPIDARHRGVPSTHPGVLDAAKRPIVGVAYGKGTRQYVKFSSSEPPAGAPPEPPRCGFCHGNNMIWQLKCAFCGCERVNGAPRMRYVVNMLLSLDPHLTASKLAHKLLTYAQFDATAMQADAAFRQATMVRTRVAMNIMSRSSDALRHHIVRMMFCAWKKLRAEATANEDIMARLIRIKEIQTRARRKAETFRAWLAYAYASKDDRELRLAAALDRRKRQMKQRVWVDWLRFLTSRLRKRCRHMKYTLMSNDQTRTSEELVHLKSVVNEIKGSLVAAIDTAVAVTSQLLPLVDVSLQELTYYRALAPDTVGYALELTCAAHVTDALTVHDLSTVSDVPVPTHDAPFATLTTQTVLTARAAEEAPHSVVLRWLNATISAINETSEHKVLVHMPTLSDVFAHMASPKLVLHLLWHLAPMSRAAYDDLFANECAKDPLLASATHHHAHHVQWKLFFELAREYVHLTHDVASRDHVENGDFAVFFLILLHFFARFGSSPSTTKRLTNELRLSIDSIWAALRPDVFHAYETDFRTRESCRNLLRDLEKVQHAQARLFGLQPGAQAVVENHRARAIAAGMRDLGRRLDGRDALVTSALQQQRLAATVSLDFGRVEFMCPSKDDFHAIEALFAQHVVPLMGLYRAVGVSSGGNTVSEQEFYKLMAEAGVLDRKIMARGYLQVLVQHTTDKHEPTTTERTLAPHEFIEALLRVAHHMSQKLASANASPPNLVTMVTDLVTNRLLPLASELEKQSLTTFKRQLGATDVQAVLRSHDKKLKKVFAFYAVEHRGKRMNLPEFEAWLKDQHLCDATFPFQRAKQLFLSAMHHSDTANEMDLELLFGEFVEAVVAVAVYRNPNPYASLAERLQVFFNDHLPT
ncbi:hypothetical protein ACHHYP_01986 [Achlya hypogyna]|uniref:Uncharacterized protein n=1 Tax=Achlya hypogyna TaxID=1202772 RepID=A0A1V9Z7I2_ACHHY|nr:hypothetical protein ACHHYP_01986 [Achlya hypogyna]